MSSNQGEIQFKNSAEQYKSVLDMMNCESFLMTNFCLIIYSIYHDGLSRPMSNMPNGHCPLKLVLNILVH